MVVQCRWANKVKGKTVIFRIVSYPETHFSRLPELQIEEMFTKSIGEDKAMKIIASPYVTRLG